MQPPTIRSLTGPLALLLLAFAGITLAALAASPGGEAAKPNRYIGAAKCKNCHSYEAAGDQYTAWTEMKHARAWDVLGTEEARKVAADLGIDDPQKSDRCLKCHTTGHGEPEEMFKKGFDLEMGVQCETCHGPGVLHLKARSAAAAIDDSVDDGDGVPAYVQIP